MMCASRLHGIRILFSIKVGSVSDFLVKLGRHLANDWKEQHKWP